MDSGPSTPSMAMLGRLSWVISSVLQQIYALDRKLSCELLVQLRLPKLRLAGFVGGLFTSMALITKIDYEGFFGKGLNASGSKKKPCCHPKFALLYLLVPVAYCSIGIPLIYELNAERKICENIFCRSLSCIEFPPGDSAWWSCDIKSSKEIICRERVEGKDEELKRTKRT